MKTKNLMTLLRPALKYGAALLVVLGLPPLHAVDIVWTGDNGLDWYGGTAGADTSWDTNDFPVAGDDVVIPSVLSASDVTLAGTAAAAGSLGSLRVGDLPILGEVFYSPVLFLENPANLSTTGDVRVAVGAGFFGDILWNDAPAAVMDVGADLTVSDGTNSVGALRAGFSGPDGITASLMVASDTFIARNGGFGTIEWDGALFQTGSLFIADVAVESNGEMRFGGGQMTVTDRFETGVTGLGRFDSNGVFGISNLDTKDALFGVNEGSEGYAELGFCQWELEGQLRVGIAGNSLVEVGDNALITIATPGDSPSIVVGEAATSTAMLSIQIYGDAGGGVTANHQAIIGLDSMNADLLCGGGGSLTTGKHTSPSGSSCIIGENAGSNGRAVMEQGGSLHGDGATVVGFFGTGSLQSSNYGWVDCADLVVAREAGSTGDVLAENFGQLTLTEGCYIGGSPTAVGGTGTVTLDLDGELFAGTTLLIHSTGELRTSGLAGAGRCLIGTNDFMTPVENDTVNVRPDGTVKGNGKIVGSLLATGGRVEPGLSAGKLTVTANAEMRGGSVLGIEIGGATPETQYDVLDTDGTFTFSGPTVEVDLIGGFIPVAGQAFKVIDAATYAGALVTMDLSGAVLPSPLTWDTSTLTTDGTLRVNGSVAPEVAIKAIRRIPSTDDIELTILGTSGTNYIVETSLNLLPPWGDISGVRVATGAEEFFVISGAVPADPKRFFRLAY